MRTPEITAAFEHIRKFYPEITAVSYDRDSRWIFTDSHGDAPEFSEFVDVGILEDAAASIAGRKLPAYFNYKAEGRQP